jgi:hypothetical protein
MATSLATKTATLRRLLVHFGLADMKDHLLAQVAEHRYFASNGECRRWTAWPVSLAYVVGLRVRATVCDLRGHDYVASGADVENGSEDLHCNRCGIGHTVYFS